jgi:hypothetical protein
VKAAHGNHKVIVCRDGSVDRAELISWLRSDHYRVTREQNYAFLRPRVVVEEFALGGDTVPEDYKIYCVDGVPKCVFMVHGRFVKTAIACYDLDWNPQPIWEPHRPADPVPRPANLERILAVAAALAQGFSQVRVDLYSDGTTVKVGELTNLQASGKDRIRPREIERAFSRLLLGEPLEPAAT